jgi:hypothetical protein
MYTAPGAARKRGEVQLRDLGEEIDHIVFNELAPKVLWALVDVEGLPVPLASLFDRLC